MPIIIPIGTGGGTPSSASVYEPPESPLILSENKVTPIIDMLQKDYSNIIVSSEEAGHEKRYMFDRDITTYWEGTSESDLTEETIEVSFYDGDTAIEKTFDSLFLVNHNIESFKLEYFISPSTWVQVLDVPGNDKTTNFFPMAKYTSTKIRLTLRTTIIPDQKKRIAEFILAEELAEFDEPLDNYAPSNIASEGNYRLEGHDLITWHVKEKYTVDIGIDLIDRSFLEELKSVYDRHENFYWIPEPADYPEEHYLVYWVSKWKPRYTTKYKGAGYNIRMRFEEV